MYIVWGKKMKIKKFDPRAKSAPPRFNSQVMRVEIFLWVKNINSIRQKLRVMQVYPASPTHFVISNQKCNTKIGNR